MQPIIDYLLANPGTVFLVGVAVAGFVWGKPKVDAALSDKRTQRIAGFAEIAFHAVEEIAGKVGLPQGVTKGALYLEKLTKLLEDAGHDGLAVDEHPLAQEVARAINAKIEALAPVAAVVAAPVIAAAVAPPPSPSTPPA